MAKNPAPQLIWDKDEITPRLVAMPVALDRAISAVMAFHEPQVQAYARNNAPWADRTSNARNGLMARAFKEGQSHGIELSHGVPYGIWLEVRFNGRYAIIEPTVRAQGPEVMRTIRTLMRRL